MDVHYPSPAWLPGSTDAFQQFYNSSTDTNPNQPTQQQLTPPSAASNLSLNLSALSVTAAAASTSTPVSGSPHLSASSATMSPGSPHPPQSQQQQQNYPFQHPDWFDAAQQQSQQTTQQQQQQQYLSRRPSQSLRKKRSDVLTIEESSLEDIAAASHHGAGVGGPHAPMELVNPNFDDADMPFAPVSDNSPIETNSGTEQQESDPATSFSVIGKSSAPNNFVAKLYHMINDSKSAHFIAWTEPGTSFVVSNVGEFSRSILGAHFKHNNFSSFVRQLNMYGFHKINRTPRAQRTSTDAQTWEFSHHKFLRGRPDLLEEIKRKALDASSSSPLAGLFGSSALGGGPGGSGLPGSSSLDHHAHLNGVRGAYGAELARLEVQIGRISATEGRVNAVEGRVRNLEGKVNNGAQGGAQGAAGAIAEVWELFRRERERNQRLVGVVKMLYEVVGRGYAGGELPLPFPNDLLLDPELPDRSGTDPTIFITSPSDPSLMGALDVTTPQPSSAASQSFQHAYYPQRHSPNSSPTSTDFQSPATPGSARYRERDGSSAYPHRDFRGEFRDLPHSFGGLPQSAPGNSSAMASARHPLVHRISFESNTSSSSRYEGRYESSHARFDSSSSGAPVPPLSSSPSLDQLSSSSNDGRPGTSGTDGRPSNKRQRTEHSPENMNIALAMDKSMSNLGLSLAMDITPSSAPSSVTNGSVLGFTPSSSPFSSAASVSSVTTFGSNVPTTPGGTGSGVGIGVPSGASTTPTTPGSGGPHRKISRARSDSAPMGMGLGAAFGSRATSYGSGSGTMNISASLSGGLRPRSGSVMAGGANGYGAGGGFNLGGDGAFRPILSGVMVKDEALHMR